MMAEAALALYVVWALLAFGLRTLVQVRRTGDTGFRGVGGRPGSLEWWAAAFFATGIVGGALAPLGRLVGVIDPVRVLDEPGVNGLGAFIAGAGVLGTLTAQLAMRDSWRIGVDPSERTALVTGGPFGVVRNPIFTAMLTTALGLTLMVPNPIALAGLAASIIGVQLQVRLVEEPYLRSVHGVAYAEYVSRVGRFLPILGREQDLPERR